MNIEYYREFVELARCLSFTEAASNLHMTQPALSKHIVALEREFEAELFIRDRRSVQLSEAGRVLYGAAINFIETYDQAHKTIERLTKTVPIRVDGVMYDTTVSSIVSLATVLLGDNDSTPVIFSHQEDAPLFELLEKNELDIVFGYDDETIMAKKGLVFRPLFEARFVAVLGKNHPLASRKHLSMKDLQDEVFVQFIDNYSISGWKRIEAVCKAHGFSPKKRPILGRAVTSYATTSPDGGVLILQQNLRQVKFLSETKQLPCIPIIDDDAMFIIYCIYKQENAERLKDLLDVLDESREIILKRRTEQSR